MSLHFSWPLSRIISGSVLVALCAAFIGLLPMSGNFVRFVLWSLTGQATGSQGHVKVRGVSIHYVSYGKGPAVLLLHGGLSNRLSWFSQLPSLVASGHQVVLMDTRGHGESGLGKGELSYRLLASDAIQVLDKLLIQQADVVGWSDGGNTALMLGLDWAQRVRRLVLISANFSPSGLTPEAQKDSTSKSSGLAYWLKRWWTGAGDRLNELETRVKRMWRTRPQLHPTDLEEITVPTLVIVGRTDVVSLSHARQLAQFLPLGTLEIVPGGHATPVTQASRVNELIAKFLEMTPTE